MYTECKDIVTVWLWIQNKLITIQSLRSYCICTLVAFIIWKFVKEKVFRRNLPPGPWGLPILGFLPWIYKGPPHNTYLRLSERYGNLVYLRLGSTRLLCVGCPVLLRDLFNRNDSIGRPNTPLNNLMEGLGIVLTEGMLWRRHRQFLFEKFRALGVSLWNKHQFQHHILIEVEELIKVLGNLNGKPVDPAFYLGRYIHNTICQLMMSFRFTEDDPEFKLYNERVTKGMELYGAIHIGEHLPWYLKLPGKMQVMKEIKRNLEDISNFHKKHVQKRLQERKHSKHQEPVDLLDWYLDELEKEAEGDSKMFAGVEPEKQIVQVMNDLFSAGMETSRNALCWMLVMMVREPGTAKRVREELARVVAPGEVVTMEHRTKLPYIEAVLYETLRRTSVVPLGTVHVNTGTWNVNGYTIPAGTQIVPLICKMNMDPKIYPEPEKFIPERFLNGNVINMPKHFMAFGVGRRVCLGEHLSKMQLLLFFCNIVNNFDICLPEGDPMPSLEGNVSTTHAPLPFKLKFKQLNLTS